MKPCFLCVSEYSHLLGELKVASQISRECGVCFVRSWLPCFESWSSDIALFSVLDLEERACGVFVLSEQLV